MRILQTMKKTQQHYEYETKEKEITISQDAEYWQTNGNTMKMKKINSYEYQTLSDGEYYYEKS